MIESKVLNKSYKTQKALKGALTRYLNEMTAELAHISDHMRISKTGLYLGESAQARFNETELEILRIKKEQRNMIEEKTPEKKEMSNKEKIKKMKAGKLFNIVDDFGEIITWAGQPQAFELCEYSDNSFAIDGHDSSMNVDKITSKYVHLYTCNMLKEILRTKLNLDRVKFLKCN